MKKNLVILAVFGLFIGFSGAEQLEIVVVNMGQGDSIFIQAPNGLRLLVDAGTGSDADPFLRTVAYDNLTEVLYTYGVSKSRPLDYLIVTHFHGDHYDYVDNVIQDFGLPNIAVIDRGGEKKISGSNTVALPVEYLNAVKPKRNAKGLMNPGDKIDLGSGCYMQLLAMGKPDNTDKVPYCQVWGQADAKLSGEYENGKSLVFVLRWNGFDMLLGGDSNEEVEPEISQILLQKKIKVDVYKVHHHGAETSSEGNFLRVLMPEVSICSTGHASSYKHPRKEAYDRIHECTKTFIFQTNRGYGGDLAYEEPPQGWGVLARGNVEVRYDGGKEYTVRTPAKDYRYSKDE